MKRMEHMDFHISYRCTNQCLFCSSAGSLRRFRAHPLDYEKIISVLKKKKGEFSSVNFTGGEPSLLPFLPRLVREAKALGYRIYIGTNGAGFADRDFCRKTAPYIDQICFSLHGPDAAVHDLHTGRKGSFALLKKAMDHFSEFDSFRMSNTVMTRHNFVHLEKILALLSSGRIRQALLSNLAPEGRGLKNYRKLAVRLEDIRQSARRLASLARRKHIILRFFGVPACVLGEHTSLSNDLFWDPRLNLELAEIKDRFVIRKEKAQSPVRNRVYTGKCARCSFRGICGGVFKEYVRVFGDDGLRSM